MDLTVSKGTEKGTTLTDFNTFIETVTKEDALDSIKNLAQTESEDWFRIGMVLSSYRKSKGEEEFKHLLHYAEENFQINFRKAYYLISIYENLVSSSITPAQVSQIGWTKLKEVAPLLNADNVEYWVDICKSNTTKQIITLLKSNGTTNVAKAEAIEDALETPTKDTSQDISKDIYKDTPETAPEVLKTPIVEDTPGIVVGYDFTKEYDNNGAIIGEIVEGVATHYAKYDSSYEEPTVDYPDTIDEVIDTPVTPPPNNAGTEVTMTVSQLAAKLKVYDLDIVLSTITEIFPHIELLVSEAQDVTSYD